MKKKKKHHGRNDTRNENVHRTILHVLCNDVLSSLVVSWIVNVYFKRNDLNETFNASSHSHLIIDFEKGENNLNNK